MFRTFIVFALTSLGLLSPRPAPAYSYTIINLGAPGISDTASDINNDGTVVGVHFKGPYDGNAGFVYVNGGFSLIDLGSGDTITTGINDSGTVVGYFDNGTGRHGFLWDGAATTIDVPGSSATILQGINDAGAIVGSYGTGTGVNFGSGHHGFVFSGGAFNDIDVLGALFTEPIGINDNDQVVGYFAAGTTSNQVEHGFVLDGGVFSIFDYPGATRTVINGINDAGMLIGHAWMPNDDQFSFVYQDGSFRRLAIPGAHYIFAQGLNDNGVVVGTVDDDYGRHGFIEVAAVPEPDSLLLVATGLAALGWVRRRSR